MLVIQAVVATVDYTTMFEVTVSQGVARHLSGQEVRWKDSSSLVRWWVALKGQTRRSAPEYCFRHLVRCHWVLGGTSSTYSRALKLLKVSCVISKAGREKPSFWNSLTKSYH